MAFKNQFAAFFLIDIRKHWFLFIYLFIYSIPKIRFVQTKYTFYIISMIELSMTSNLLYETFEIVNSFSMIIYQSHNQNLEERNNNLYFLINSLQFLLYCVSNSQSFLSYLIYHQNQLHQNLL